jgi:hypothetical protein
MVIGVGANLTRSGVTKAGHAKIMKRLNGSWMWRHANIRLPKHFENVPETTPGSGGYRYRKRSARYTKQKQRKYGHTRPNVATGELRSSVLAKVKITATQYKSTLVTRGTREHRLADWQRQEIAAVSIKERREEAKLTARNYKRLAKSPQYKARRKRKVK